ncbi:hypothetical protein [Streptomyces vinaceus]|uniref:hypothetical protein n=1 Tax=Streptomyces vinaceus TaxID=1960 RepID=UPI0010CE9099|nr:hypothetical protein [Streptomyces vinaceus]GHE64317.1 hypothetical protein GCM10017778_56270 [Streptomyces vinaceus]
MTVPLVDLSLAAEQVHRNVVGPRAEGVDLALLDDAWRGTRVPMTGVDRPDRQTA